MDKINFKSLEELAKIDFEALEEELAKIDPVELRYLSQLIHGNAPVVEKIIQNVLDAPISEETQKHLQPPLNPKPFQPIAPTRNRNRKQYYVKVYDPFQPNKIRTVKDYQSYMENLYDVRRFDGEESKGQRYIRWRFNQNLDENYTQKTNLNEDHTQKFMEKIRENVKTSFYMRHVYAYILENEEDGTMLIFYTNKGSPWINKLEDAEKWLQAREDERLDPDNIKRPTTKWKFLRHFLIDLKVVLDRKPLMGTGPLPDWLRNLARGCHAMVTLDTYRDNLCLWRCIAVHGGARQIEAQK